jgi:uncharacterized damage-inducible protein DinB
VWEWRLVIEFRNISIKRVAMTQAAPMSEIHVLFLEFSARKLNQLAERIQDCLGRLNETQIWMRDHENQNSVGNLVLHLCGNLGQWIGTGVAGRPDTRLRQAEFDARGGISREELGRRLEEAVRDATALIERLTPERLRESLTVQNYPVSVLEAVYHVVEHFAQHTGQIIFVTKWFTGEDLGYYRHLSSKAQDARPQTP